MSDIANKAIVRSQRLSRRQLLRLGSAVAIGMAASNSAACSFFAPPGPPDLPPRPRALGAGPDPDPTYLHGGFPNWSRHARLANASGLTDDPDEEEMTAELRALKSQYVNVVESDTNLSDWLEDDQWAVAMGALTHWNRLVHAAGLRVIWYYPSMEVLSPAADVGPSFFKEHPDWAQISLKGDPNVFVGGSEEVKVVFWVDPGVESMWMSPNSPWREYYLERVKQIAATGADGIWPDVPLYFDVLHLWCDTSPWARAAFRADSGFEIPSQSDWKNPVWRRWVEWRHRNLNQWLLDICAAGRSVNPNFVTFIETVTCDHMDATTMGLDGAYLRLAENVTQAWEVDTVSDSHSMYYATPDDWICMIAIYKYCRAASGNKPSWVFSKGYQAADAAGVMAEAIIVGNNPYEVKVPGKTIGVDIDMRARMYRFVAENTERIFDATSLAKVALYHSSACRDYVAPSDADPPPSGVYCSTDPPPGVGHWWSDRGSDSRYEFQWLGEYTGWVKALVHGHVPFSTLTSPTFRAEDLQGYEVLVLPDIEALSDHEAEIMRQFVHHGGTIVITGPDPTGLNQLGDARPEYALADLLGFGKRARRPAESVHRSGAGQLVYLGDLPGWSYLQTDNAAAYGRMLGAVLQGTTPFVTTDADPRVHLEASQLGEDTILQFSNLIGARSPYAIIPTSFAVSVVVPEGKQALAVEASSPDRPSPELEPITFAVDADMLTFTLDLAQYALVLLRWA